LERRYLEEVRRFIPVPRLGFYLLSSQAARQDRCAAVGVSDYFLSRYEERGRALDPLLHHVLEHKSAVHSGALMTAKQWRSLEFYEEVLHLHRMMNVLEAPIVSDGLVIGTLNFETGDPNRACTQTEVDLATAIGRLVGVALKSLRERETLERDQEHLIAGLELCDAAVVLTDLQSGKRRSNAAARQLIGRLPDGMDGAWVDELLATEAREGQVRTGQIEAKLPDGSHAVLRSRSMRAPENPSMIVTFLVLEDEDAKHLPQFVQRALTAREYEVAGFAALGLRDGEIAERLLLSPYTVKEYLKSSYRKLNLRSRVELTHLLANRHSPIPSSEGD